MHEASLRLTGTFVHPCDTQGPKQLDGSFGVHFCRNGYEIYTMRIARTSEDAGEC